MQNIRLVIEYDGTDFHGWQRQPGLRTVQGEIEGAIFRVSRERVGLIGSGRTDAGVHARGQVANFVTNARHSPVTWRAALNANLPADLAVVLADRADRDFHARRSAKGRVYEYRILRRPARSPIEGRFAWHLAVPLDVAAMRRAARLLRGKHDFSSFCAAGDEQEDRWVDLREIRLLKEGESLLLRFEASRFLWHMVRNIVGFLVEVGRGRIAPSEVGPILEARDRRRAGPTAPPQGLCLMEVRY
jgi:tRNA pseudouridine38-40 synthase